MTTTKEKQTRTTGEITDKLGMACTYCYMQVVRMSRVGSSAFVVSGFKSARPVGGITFVTRELPCVARRISG